MNYSISPDTPTCSAPQGVTGTLLLDPADVTITTGVDSNENLAGGTYTPTLMGATSSNILNTELQNQLGNSSIQIVTTSSGTGPNGGSITVSAPVSWAAGTSLTLTAATSITVSAASAITQTSTTSGGNITLTAGAGHGLTINSNVTTASAGGVITLTGDTLSLGRACRRPAQATPR